VWDKAGFAAFADRVMEQLASLECEDPDGFVDLAEGVASFECTVVDTELLDGLLKAVATMRTAFHAAGASTPGFQAMTDHILQTLEVTASVADQEGHLASA
jgi:hypothetical protein